MARPMVSETAEEAYAALIPWTEPDETQDWPLLRFVAAYTSLRAQIDELVREGEHPGWSSIVDIDRAPASGLPWLGQLLGVDIDESLSEADQRQQLRDVPSYRRGTPAALVGAAKPYLTGTKTVMLDERDTSAYHFRVRTFNTETPDPSAVEAALRSQKPAGLVMSYESVDGLTWGEIKASGKTYAELTDLFPTPGALKHAQSIP